MFRDELRCKVWDEIRQHDLRAFAKFLTPELFAEAAERSLVKLGKGPLHLVNVVWLGIAAALHVSRSFAKVLTLTLKLLQDSPGFSSTPLGKVKQNAQRRKGRGKRSKHDPHGGDPTAVTEEAFCQARQHMPLEFWMWLLFLLGERFRAEHGPLACWNGFRLLALDGTCIDLPHHAALKAYYGTTRRRGGRTVQARMVMLQLPLVRFPWRYTVSPLSVSEKTSAASLLEFLEPNDLVLMDRGFWSCGLFWQIQSRQAYFAIRLVRGAKFRTIRRLGKNDRLIEWRFTRPTRKKWENLGLPESIRLRVIPYQIRGYRPSAIVTNVLDPRRISAEDWVRLAKDCEPGRNLTPGLYHRRWEIETTFRELKSTQKLKERIRSRTPKGVEYEIAAHVLLYLLARWLMVEAAVQSGQDPLRLSFTAALQELQDLHQQLMTSTPQRVAQVLLPRLLQRMASHTVELRPGRHFPRPNDTKPKDKGHGRIQLSAKLPTSEA